MPKTKPNDSIFSEKESKLFILGAFGDTKAGKDFSMAWANFLAELIDLEWRRPCLNAFFGEDSDSRSGKFLNPQTGDARALRSSLNIKVERQDADSPYNKIPKWLKNVLTASGIDPEKNQSHIIEAMNSHLQGLSLNPQDPLPSASEDNRKVLAVIGGMGPIASAEFHELLVSEAKEDETVSIWRFDINLKPQQEQFSEALSGQSFSLWRFLELLRGISVVVNDSDEIPFVVAPSNTFNGVDIANFSKIRGFSRLQHKFMNMIYVVADKVCQNVKPDTKTGLFSSSKLKASGRYEKLFEQRHVPLKTTTDREQEKIQLAIDKAKEGKSDEAQTLIREVIQSWVYQGVDRIIFACTEIYGAARQILPEFPEVDFIDSNKLLAEAAYQEYQQPGSVLLDGTAELENQFLNLLNRILSSTRFWIKQHHASERGAFILPEGVEKLRNEMMTTSDPSILKRLKKIASSRLSLSARLFRQSVTNDLYNSIKHADENLDTAIEQLEQILVKIKRFDESEHSPRLNVISFERSRALLGIQAGETRSPANLSKPYPDTLEIDPTYLSTQGYRTLLNSADERKRVDQYICKNGSLKLKALLMYEKIEEMINSLTEEDFDKSTLKNIKRRLKKGMGLDELFVFATLVSDLHFDKENLVLFLKGAQFFIPDSNKTAGYDNELCQFFMRHGTDPFPRPDSSHKASRLQYSFEGRIMREFLFGHRWTNNKNPGSTEADTHSETKTNDHPVSGTFIQTERFGHRTVPDIVRHKGTFVEYKITGENIGPYGTSPYLETNMYRLDDLNPKLGQGICANAFIKAMDEGVPFDSAIQALFMNKQNIQHLITEFDDSEVQKHFDQALVNEVVHYFKNARSIDFDERTLNNDERSVLLKLFTLKKIIPDHPLFSKEIDLETALNDKKFTQPLSAILNQSDYQPLRGSPKDEADDQAVEEEFILDDFTRTLLTQLSEGTQRNASLAHQGIFANKTPDEAYPGAAKPPRP